jgi:hypothetical protein
VVVKSNHNYPPFHTISSAPPLFSLLPAKLHHPNLDYLAFLLPLSVSLLLFILLHSILQPLFRLTIVSLTSLCSLSSPSPEPPPISNRHLPFSSLLIQFPSLPSSTLHPPAIHSPTCLVQFSYFSPSTVQPPFLHCPASFPPLSSLLLSISNLHLSTLQSPSALTSSLLKIFHPTSHCFLASVHQPLRLLLLLPKPTPP